MHCAVVYAIDIDCRKRSGGSCEQEFETSWIRQKLQCTVYRFQQTHWTHWGAEITKFKAEIQKLHKNRCLFL